MNNSFFESKNIIRAKLLSEIDILEFEPETKEKALNNLKINNSYQITYLSNGKKIKGFLIIPKQGEKLPCIIFNRGGAKEFGKLTISYVLNLLNFYASQGYIIIASQYSGNDGSDGKDEFGGADIEDVLNLKLVLEDIPVADTDRIGMLGFSRGGMMTCLVLTKANWIKAAVCIGGVYNLKRDYELRPNLLEFRKDLYNVYFDSENEKRSAVCFADKICSNTPLLLLHGTKDENVSVLDSLELATELSKNNKQFGVQIFKDGNHGLSNYKDDKNRAILSWFKKYL